MPKKQKRMVIFDEISLLCDCGEEMLYMGNLYSVKTGEFNYVCPKCEATVYHEEKFPKLTRKRYGKI